MRSISVSELCDKILVKKELTYGKAEKLLGLNKGEIWYVVNKGQLPRAKWKRERLKIAEINIGVPIEWMMLCEICLKSCLRRAHNQRTCRDNDCKRELRRRRRPI